MRKVFCVSGTGGVIGADTGTGVVTGDDRTLAGMVFFVVAFRRGQRRKKAEMAKGIEMMTLSKSQGKAGRDVCFGTIVFVLEEAIGLTGGANGACGAVFS